MQNRVVDKWRRSADVCAKDDDMRKWKSLLPLLEQDSADYRTAILDKYFENEAQALHELETTDALATMPIAKNILRDIKKDIDNELSKLFFFIFKENVNEEMVTIDEKNPEDKVVDHFKPWIQKDVAKSFEDFIMNDKNAVEYVDDKQKVKYKPFEKKDYAVLVSQLTEEVVQKKISSYLNQLFVNMCATYPTKISLLNSHKDELFKYLRTEFFLLCALRTFSGADNAQKLDGYYEKLMFKLHYKEGTQLRKPFLALPFCMDGLEYRRETNELWHELNLYLKGFYNHVLHRDPKVPDKTDHQMQQHLHVTKLEMASHNLGLIDRITPHLLPKEVLRPQRKNLVSLFFTPVIVSQRNDGPIARPLTPGR